MNVWYDSAQEENFTLSSALRLGMHIVKVLLLTDTKTDTVSFVNLPLDAIKPTSSKTQTDR